MVSSGQEAEGLDEKCGQKESEGADWTVAAVSCAGYC